jgi:hypothetical protein
MSYSERRFRFFSIWNEDLTQFPVDGKLTVTRGNRRKGSLKSSKLSFIKFKRKAMRVHSYSMNYSKRRCVSDWGNRTIEITFSKVYERQPLPDHDGSDCLSLWWPQSGYTKDESLILMPKQDRSPRKCVHASKKVIGFCLALNCWESVGPNRHSPEKELGFSQSN